MEGLQVKVATGYVYSLLDCEKCAMWKWGSGCSHLPRYYYFGHPSSTFTTTMIWNHFDCLDRILPGFNCHGILTWAHELLMNAAAVGLSPTQSLVTDWANSPILSI